MVQCAKYSMICKNISTHDELFLLLHVHCYLQFHSIDNFIVNIFTYLCSQRDAFCFVLSENGIICSRKRTSKGHVVLLVHVDGRSGIHGISDPLN